MKVVSPTRSGKRPSLCPRVKGTKSILQAKERRQNERSSEKKRTFLTSICVTSSHLLEGETVVVGAGAVEEATTAAAREAEDVDVETATEDEAMASFVADTVGAAVDVTATRSTSRTKTRFPASAAHSFDVTIFSKNRPFVLEEVSIDLDGAGLV